MRWIGISILLATLLGCGSQVQEHDGNLQSIRALDKSTTALNKIRKIIKNHIHHPEEALEFLHTHPFVKTIGIRSNLFAEELGMHPSVWGRHVNGDSSLTTKQLPIDGKLETHIFAKGFLPKNQVARVIDGLDPERLKQGVAIEEIADAVHFKQDSWSTEGFHIAIGRYIDKKKYVTRQILVDGKTETRIFDKGFLPEDQVTRVIDGLDSERFKQGVAIEEVANNVHFKQDSWSTMGFHNVIGLYLDRKKYVTRQITVGGKDETRIFAKGFSPEDQVARVIGDLDEERLKQGVAIEEIADAVHFKKDSWSTEGIHKAIGSYLDKKKYVTRRIKINGKQERRIFAKIFLPKEQVARAIDALDPERLKQGVAIEEIADAVHFKQESWSTEGFHRAISRYLDKKKYVTRKIRGDGKPETRIFAK